MVLGVRIDMLREILFLSEVAPADIAHEPLETHMERDQVSLEAESGAEILSTVCHGANEGVFISFVLLTLDHLVQDASYLLLL